MASTLSKIKFDSTQHTSNLFSVALLRYAFRAFFFFNLFTIICSLCYRSLYLRILVVAHMFPANFVRNLRFVQMPKVLIFSSFSLIIFLHLRPVLWFYNRYVRIVVTFYVTFYSPKIWRDINLVWVNWIDKNIHLCRKTNHFVWNYIKLVNMF